jgi:hypothetical protein
MDAPAAELRSTFQAPQPARFHAAQGAYWLPLCVATGLLIAGAADVVQGHFSPFLLFYLMVGGVLGGTLVWLLRAAHVGHRATILWGTLLACAVATAGEHYVRYWRVREEFHEKARKEPQKYFHLNDPSLKDIAGDVTAPEGFVDFMRRSASTGLPIGGWTAREGMAWMIWGLDALLVFVPAVLLTRAAARLPYCNQCRRWYHATRNGCIDPDLARQLAAAVDVALVGEVRDARYRMIGCPGGCGPTGISLFWSQADGDHSAGPIWLSPGYRDRVQQLLDAAIAKTRQAENEPQKDTIDQSP